eukprot:878267-Pyramimonas_sp.AAC.1
MCRRFQLDAPSPAPPLPPPPAPPPPRSLRVQEGIETHSSKMILKTKTVPNTCTCRRGGALGHNSPGPDHGSLGEHPPRVTQRCISGSAWM